MQQAVKSLAYVYSIASEMTFKALWTIISSYLGEQLKWSCSQQTDYFSLNVVTCFTLQYAYPK